MRILFLDQSSSLGGAELCLADIAQSFGQDSLVCVFNEGSFPKYLRQLNISTKILTEKMILVRKESRLLTGLKSIKQIVPLVNKVAQISREYDLIYVNTPKALIVGALASILNKRPFVYHLHDIISSDHFSIANRRVLVTLANRASLVIANSLASRNAFMAAGGKTSLVHVVYNGFRTERYLISQLEQHQLRKDLGICDQFVVGSFSRLSPWKGQHILIDAIKHCSENVVVLLVGDALFGEDDYVAQLHRMVEKHNLQEQVRFLGFRKDIPQLMSTCNLVVHTSTAPEPFGRVIAEAMLCGTPIIATAAGGALELIEHGRTGWLCPPGNSEKLGCLIDYCENNPEATQNAAFAAKEMAKTKFDAVYIGLQIKELLEDILQISV